MRAGHVPEALLDDAERIRRRRVLRVRALRLLEGFLRGLEVTLEPGLPAFVVGALRRAAEPRTSGLIDNADLAALFRHDGRARAGVLRGSDDPLVVATAREEKQRSDRSD